jgi:thymidylate kinase
MTMDQSDLSLLSRLLPAEHVRHGVPAPDTVVRHEAAVVAASSLLGFRLMQDGIRVSPLGPGWSRDIDLHVTAQPPPRLLMESGWLPLDDLLRRIGSDGEGRWAVVADGRALAGADLTTAAVPEPFTAWRRRALRRREVRVREVLELRVLQRRGVPVPAGDPVVEAAATLEAALGGDDLRRFAPAPSGPEAGRTPVPLPAGRGASVRRHVGALRRAVRPRVVVGVSGVDGSGKSSLTRRIADDLDAVGVPASILWTRPGMRLKALAATARLAHRLLHLGPAPTVRAVAGGEPGLASRRGTVGWLWAVCVSVAFVGDVRRRHAGARGVVLYDRHLLDALVTLDFVYEGVDLRLARWIVRRAVPRARLCLYVEVPVDVAVARKPGDTFGEYAVRRQLDGYATRRKEFPGVVVLDGQADPDDLTLRALRHLTGAVRTSPTTPRR